MRTNSKSNRKWTVSGGLTDEQRRIMLLGDIKNELERANDQRAEILELLRETIDAEEVSA